MTTYFPTEFAKKKAIDYGLFYGGDMVKLSRRRSSRSMKRFQLAEDQFERLEEFQKLSISGEFEEALVAYDGYELTEEQTECLGIIHSSTGTWARGELVAKILDHLSETRNGKDIKELSLTMMSIMGIEGIDDGKGKKKIEALIIETTSG